MALEIGVCYAMLRFCNNCWVDLPVFIAYVNFFFRIKHFIQMEIINVLFVLDNKSTISNRIG